MTPQEKWEVVKGMMKTAREIRRSAIRMKNPDWAADEVERELAREFACART